jgi:hypothetical protein
VTSVRRDIHPVHAVVPSGLSYVANRSLPLFSVVNQKNAQPAAPGIVQTR